MNDNDLILGLDNIPIVARLFAARDEYKENPTNKNYQELIEAQRDYYAACKRARESEQSVDVQTDIFE